MPLLEDSYITLPAALVEQERIRHEKERERKWRYEMSHAGRRHGAYHPHGSRDRRVPLAEYEFIGFDGEATTDCGYCLMGSSAGNTLVGENLTTEDMLNFILDTKREYPQSILIIFGGRYDFDEIIRRSMPWDRIAQIKNHGATFWHGFKIKQAEGKWFEIAKDGITARVFEIFGWFHCSYEGALERYRIAMTAADHELIRLGKLARGTFTYADIKNVARYMHAELRYMPDLMNQIRTICHNAGFRPRAWYGPSALATELLTKNKIKQYQAECPPEVNLAAQYAYAGGRFEMPRGGIINVPVYCYDWNSAYMRAALELPCLAHGSWRYSSDRNCFAPGRFGVYHIRYREKVDGYPAPINHRRIYPLFRRYADGRVLFCNKVQGWYWSPEAELVKDDSNAEFLEGWIWEQECTHVPFACVRDLYSHRMVLENLPDSNPAKAAGQGFKWCLASIYGQLCRSVGWDEKKRKAPRYHQLEWAGYITSRCRAEMYRLALQAGDHLLSIDTDSVTATIPLIVEEGKELGQWKSSEAAGGIFFQNGIYYTYTYGTDGGLEWSKGKARGIERSPTPVLSPDILHRAISDGMAVTLRPKRRYVTLRMALGHRTDAAGNWEEHPSDKLMFGGGGKRYHNLMSCHHTCKDGVHLFLHNMPVRTTAEDDYMSVRYPLPWKDEMPSFDKMLSRDIVWINPEHIDEEDKWILQLVPQ